MNIKLIVTDLDNTLLRNDKTISEYSSDVFKRVRNKGILTAFATARDFRFVTEFISPASGIIPDIIISDNGALARYNCKDLYRKLIPAKTANLLMAQFKLVRCVSTDKAYYLSGDYSNDHWSINKKETILSDKIDYVEEDVFYIDGDIGNSFLSMIDIYPEIRAVTYSDVELVTIVHREATKLNALNAVKSALNIDSDNIAVFGDDYSDIEILSNFKTGIAVENAISECKAAANYFCGHSDEDGVAHWIEENIMLYS